MKVLLDTGHCLRGGDTGAQGNGYREENCTREIGYKVKSKLESLGHTVIICSCDSSNSLNESLAYRVNTANKNGGDLYVSIHINAGGGVGTEVWCGSQSSVAIAQNILNGFIGLGFKNRGVKIQGQNGNGHLYVLNNTNMSSLLVECCFIDTSDMQKYNAENFANAIVKGITGQSITPSIPTKFYVVTNYLLQGEWGVELNTLWYKYFTGLGVERWYVKSNEKGLWLYSQYMSKENAQTLADRLKKDGLLYQLVSE